METHHNAHFDLEQSICTVIDNSELHNQRVNKVNFRKEIFSVDFNSIRKTVESLHGEVDYHAEPEALYYRESATMPNKDYELIEHDVGAVEGEAK